MNQKGALTSTLISENPSEITNSYKGNIESEDKCCNESLKELKQKNLNCPIIAQLNINSIRNKFQFLEKKICANLDIILISETKPGDSFSAAQFLLDRFLKPYRLDRCSNGGRSLLYIRDDIPSRLFLIQIKLKVFLLRLISRKINC